MARPRSQHEVVVCGSRAQRRRVAPHFVAKHAVELSVAAEASPEGGGERGGALAPAVEAQETLQSLLVAKPADRHARLRPEQAAQVRGAEARGPRERGKVACGWVRAQQ